MDIDNKTLLGGIGGLLTFAFTFGGLFARQQAQGKRINKLEKVMSSGDDGGAPFITVPEHDKLQQDCRTHILSEIAHTKEYLEVVHKAQVESKKDADIKHEAVITTLAGLEATIHERIK